MKAISYYYLVDMENVGLQGLYGLNMPEEDSAIILFISNNFHMATEEIQEDILKSKADISTIFCSVMRKNAMDFQMAAYFGSVLNKKETKRVSIISQDGGFKALQVKMEVRLDGFDGLQDAAVVANIEAVFDEIWRGAEDFLAGREDGAEEGVETAGGTDGQNQMLLADGDALLFRQIFRKCLADIIIACIGHVA